MKAKLEKGIRGIFRVIFSRLFMFLLMIVLQIAFLCLLVLNVNHYFEIFYQVLRVVTVVLVIYIINENRTDPTMKLIWSVLILSIPIFGTLFYLYVKFQPSTMILKKKINAINDSTGGFLAPDRTICDNLMRDDPETYGLSNYIFSHTGYPVYDNTEVTYFASGEEKYGYLLEELNKAQKFIFMEYFIIEEGKVWNSVLEILERKKKEGVEVRVMYDGMCSLVWLPVGYYKKLREKGLDSKPFSPMRPFVSTTQNNRDHRKIVVIDGKVAFTGGINLADEYMNLKVRFGYWEDCGVMFRGEAVKSFTLMFLRLWNIGVKTTENFEPYMEAVKEPPALTPAPRGLVIGYADEPFDSENVSESVYLHLLNTARHYVHIVTPYLVIDNVIMGALKFAAKRGVEVIILMPAIPDKPYAYCTARTYYEELIAAGVKIYEFTPGFTHGKMFIADGEKATVGTANLDYRSLYLHFECGSFIYKDPSIAKMEDTYQQLIAHSHLVTMHECKSRPFYYKIAGKLLRLVAPLL